MIVKKEIHQWKKDAVDDLADLIQKYKVLGLVDLSNMPDNLIQLIRMKLRDKALIKMSKKSLILRALEKSEKKSKKKNLIKFGEKILGQSGLIFTNEDPFALKRLFDENRLRRFAKEGDIAQEDIIVYEGDTGLPTGQAITELHLVLKLPTKIKNDTIWITSDKITHYQGDVIPLKEAIVLRKLNIKPIEVNIKFYCAWDNGEIIPNSILNLDVEDIKRQLSLGILQALDVACELPFLIDDAVEYCARKAALNANIVYSQIFEEKTFQIEEDKVEEVEEEPELKDEDQPPEGLGSLFG